MLQLCCLFLVHLGLSSVFCFLCFLDCSVLIAVCNLKESSVPLAERQPCQTEHKSAANKSPETKNAAKAKARDKRKTQGKIDKRQWTLCVVESRVRG